VIFVTVGAQMPFDRLVKVVDRWAGKRGREDLFAQIGRAEYRPTRMRWTAFLEPGEFKRRFETAKAVVAHAGIGTIITALQMGKPIIVMPRRAKLRETRTDHQVATAERFSRFESVVVAWDEEQLANRLEDLDQLRGCREVGRYASDELIASIREFILSVDRSPT
jgi:UDP-N-acetylglucosamine transferase subunit ALG13